MGEVGGWVGGWGQIRVAALNLDEHGTAHDACNPEEAGLLAVNRD
jgi:hypothetical protein